MLNLTTTHDDFFEKKTKINIFFIKIQNYVGIINLRTCEANLFKMITYLSYESLKL